MIRIVLGLLFVLNVVTLTVFTAYAPHTLPRNYFCTVSALFAINILANAINPLHPSLLA